MPDVEKAGHVLRCDGRPLGYRVKEERPWSCSCGAKFYGYDTPVKKAYREHKRASLSPAAPEQGCGFMGCGHPDCADVCNPSRFTPAPPTDTTGPEFPLPIVCRSCGRALANLREWCCGRFVTADDVVSSTPESTAP